MKRAMEICCANANTERTKSDADRQAMRANFPFAAHLDGEK